MKNPTTTTSNSNTVISVKKSEEKFQTIFKWNTKCMYQKKFDEKLPGMYAYEHDEREKPINYKMKTTTVQ